MEQYHKNVIVILVSYCRGSKRNLPVYLLLSIKNIKLSTYHTETEKSLTCKGICIRYKAQRESLASSAFGGGWRYANGQKRCQACEIFLRWDRLRCPCCGYRLRTRSRSVRLKAKLRIIKRIE
jgi:hypothetical protein